MARAEVIEEERPPHDALPGVRLPVAGVAPGIRDCLHSQEEFELGEENEDVRARTGTPMPRSG